MVVKADRYFGPPFQGSCGVTQVHPLSPTVINMVVDAVIQHWVTGVVPMEARAEGLGDTIQELVLLFYAYYRLVALPWIDRLQREFKVLTDLSSRVGLRTNVQKKLSMACRPYYIPGIFLQLVYTR